MIQTYFKVGAIFSALTLSLAWPLASSTPLVAQDVRIQGMGLQEREVMERLRSSGLSASQIRTLLSQQGYPAGTGESYLQAMESGGFPQGNEDPTAILRSIEEARRTGLLDDRLGAPLDFGRWDGLQEERERRSEPDPDSIPVFGRDLFAQSSPMSQAPLAGPVPAGYRVGPGDELLVVITGEVERVFNPVVSQEGWVVFPGVGRVAVSGLTTDELQQTLESRFALIYSGLRDEQGTTFLHASLGRLRATQVMVVGEVERPGAQILSAGNTDPLRALYLAGGPTRNGTFRNIQVIRNGVTVGTLDIYDYLDSGRLGGTVQLRDEDVLFVPLVGPRVEVTGAVARPAYFEPLPGEGLGRILDLAGGLRAEAHSGVIQLERFLPDELRDGGRDREVVDVVLGAEEGAWRNLNLRDGDRIAVLPALAEAANPVVVSGAVWRPGRYGVGADDRLSHLLARAGGLLPDALAGRVQLFRLTPDRRWTLTPVSLQDGAPVDDVTVGPEDRIHVVASRELRSSESVRVRGWVQRPGAFPFARGMTLADLLLLAEGVQPGAFEGAAEVTRVIRASERQDSLTQRFMVDLPEGLFEPGPQGAVIPPDHPAASFRLEPEDQVFVRRAPGYQEQRLINVTGEVLFPGEYALNVRGERIADVLARAGGITSEAYPDGLQLWRYREMPPRAPEANGGSGGSMPGDSLRDGSEALSADGAEDRREGDLRERAPGLRSQEDEVLTPVPSEPLAEELDPWRARTRVAVSFDEFERRPDSRANIQLEEGDSIHIPTYIPTVDVRGAVEVETKVLWREGAGVDYYLSQAGGYAPRADKSRTRVVYANGEVDVTQRTLWVFRHGPDRPDPGSVIEVPYRPESAQGLGLGQIISLTTSVLTAGSALLIALRR